MIETERLIKWAEDKKTRSINIDASHKYSLDDNKVIFNLKIFAYDDEYRTGQFVTCVDEINIKAQAKKELEKEIARMNNIIEESDEPS